MSQSGMRLWLLLNLHGNSAPGEGGDDEVTKILDCPGGELPHADTNVMILCGCRDLAPDQVADEVLQRYRE